MHNAENRNESALNANAALIAELRDAGAAEERADRGVVHCVVCVSEFAVCSSSLLAIVGRMAARPLVKNGEANISSALSTIEQPRVTAAHSEYEAERDDRADQVADDHDPPAVHTVEQHARDRSREHGGHRARQHDRR